MDLSKRKNSEAPMAATIEASNLPVNRETTDMKSLAKSTVNCTNSIVISDIKIHMDAEGRYSLNDLHKASGKEDKHQPAFFMRRNETIELIDEIFNSANMQNKNPVDSKKGRYGGTYVCKELVYSYAMWISAAFALKVIRAYDALVTGNANEAVRIAKTTVSERTPLRDAVNMLVGKKGLRYDDAYNMVHQRFNIDSIDELELEQIPQAVEYIHRVVLEGEYMEKKSTEVCALSGKDLDRLVWLWDYANRAQSVFKTLYPAMRALESQYAGKCFDYGHEFSYTISMARDILVSQTRNVDMSAPDGPTNLAAWLRMKNNELPLSLFPH
ncbi:P22AR C-terminal domain-containing protein [Enterobacter cloacae]|uniref:P22AR C-terminal domain-containing protein n=1 Tax=Enterobacter cloacae TaxID=550 RepID=UPI00298EF5AF|nr:P22AR C-terminal domain-containing protein [Enterobacter cloacae]MDW8494383.1 P22AR C-terminal domain-containing protein [Enterobacter cloacae subsp. cloacae]